jgi:Fe2+ or Zn2+ uptake regulation protein
MSNRDKLAEFLANRERPLTQHQGIVAEAIFATPGKFSDEEIASNLNGRASRATVYRILNLLAKADVLRQVKFNGTDVFVMTADE